MRRFDKIVVGGLVSVAGVAFVLGFGSIIYAYAVIEPRLAQVNEQAITGVEWAERGLRVLDMHSDALNALDAPQQTTIDATRKLSPVLEQSANLSRHAAQALDRSAQALRAVADATELVLPEDTIEWSTEALSTTAASLEGLAPQLNTLRTATDTLADDFAQASAGAKKLQNELQDAQVTLERAQTQLHQTRQALQAAHLPAEIARLVSLHGGMYIALSVLLIGMAGLWRRLVQLSPGNA